jgi:hypothetical protein
MPRQSLVIEFYRPIVAEARERPERRRHEGPVSERARGECQGFPVTVAGDDVLVEIVWNEGKTR